MTFNHGVRSSTLRWITKRDESSSRFYFPQIFRSVENFFCGKPVSTGEANENDNQMSTIANLPYIPDRSKTLPKIEKYNGID